MGYYVELIEVDFTIPAESVADARLAWIELNKQDDKKWNPPNFAWMHNWDDKCSAKETLKLLGFESEELEDGSLSVLSFDRKAGEEATFIQAIAHLMPDASYLVFKGEDGLVYRYIIHNGESQYQESIIAWPELNSIEEVTSDSDLEDSATETTF